MYRGRIGLCVIGMLIVVSPSEGQRWDESANLIRTLLKDYDPRVRPIEDQSQPLLVRASFEILTIQDVDEVAGKFTVSGIIFLTWHDNILTWNPADHGNINALLFPLNDIWYPQLVLTNPYSQLDVLGADWLQTRIMHDGFAISTPSNVFDATCNIDVTAYPFDTQVCSLIFAPLSYAANEVGLVPHVDVVETNFMTENGEWSLDKTLATRIPFPGGDQLLFRFHMKRKPKFVFMNVILPVMIMGMINLLVFVLPSDSGERVGFSVTVVLAFAVFLTLVADNLPKASKPMPIMSDFLTAVLILSVLMCVMTIFSLFLYHQDENKSPPKFIQSLVAILLCRVCQFKNKRVSADNTPVDTPVELFTIDEDENKKDNSLDGFISFNEDVISDVTWKDVSRALDLFCFIGCFLAQTVVDTYYMSTLLKGSNEKDETTW